MELIRWADFKLWAIKYKPIFIISHDISRAISWINVNNVTYYSHVYDMVIEFEFERYLLSHFKMVVNSFN